jgi:hypothetical protein
MGSGMAVLFEVCEVCVLAWLEFRDPHENNQSKAVLNWKAGRHITSAEALEISFFILAHN